MHTCYKIDPVGNYFQLFPLEIIKNANFAIFVYYGKSRQHASYEKNISVHESKLLKVSTGVKIKFEALKKRSTLIAFS